MKNFDGNLNSLDEEFLEYLKSLITQIIENVPAKKSLGNEELKNFEILDYFRSYAKIFESGKMPKVETVLETRLVIFFIYVAFSKQRALPMLSKCPLNNVFNSSAKTDFKIQLEQAKNHVDSLIEENCSDDFLYFSSIQG